MADSYVTYVGDGVDDDFTITFPYLIQDHVEVYVDDVLQTLTTHYSFQSATVILFVTPPADTLVVKLKRASGVSSPLVTYANASHLDADDLNITHLQNLYLHQEVLDGITLGDIDVKAANIDSESALDDYVLTADGAGNAAWEVAPVGPTGPQGPAGSGDLVDDLTPQLGGDLDANGKVVQLFDGTTALPGLAFADDPDTGLHRSGVNTMKLVTAGNAAYTISTSLFGCHSTSRPAIRNVAITATSPGFAPIQSDPDTGVGSSGADQLSLIAGGVEVARLTEVAAAVQLIVDSGLTGTAALPSLAFGNGDTGFYAVTDDVLRCTIGGTDRWQFATNLTSSNVTGPKLAQSNPSATNPTLVPRQDDADTGIGWTSADQLSLVAGGVQIANCAEVGGVGQLIVPSLASPSAPQIAFGDGDSGFYEAVDDNIYLATLGVARWKFSAAGIQSQHVNGPQITANKATDALPAFQPHKGDPDTGMGGSDATLDQLSLIAGGLVVAHALEAASAVQLIVDPGVTGTAALPSLAFGNGNSGFYEPSDDTINISLSGVAFWKITAGLMGSTSGSGPALLREAASDTNPTVVPSNSDVDTGIGSNAADQLSLIAGGVEAFRIVETAGLLTQSFIGSLQGNMITPITEKTASYTMVLSDGGRTTRWTGATASKVGTIPANASVAFPIGTMLGFENDGSVNMTVAITTDTLTWSKDNTTGTRTLAPGASAVAKKVTATSWKFSGSALVT